MIYAETTSSADAATVIFDKKIKTQNITRLIYNPHVAADSAENMPVIEYIDGEYALKRGKQVDSTMYLGIDLSDDFMYSEQAIPLDVTVEYYDLGLGSFSIQYTSEDGAKDAEVAELKNTKKWLKHKFHFDDITLINNFTGGADLRVALWTSTMRFSTTDIYIKSVEIAKSEYSEPIKLTAEAEQVGRIFGGDENKEISFKLENVTDDEISTNAEYSVLNENGDVIATGSFDITQGGRETKEHRIDLNDIKKYGVYTIEVSEKNKVGTGDKARVVENRKSFDFSIINKASLNERNTNFWINTHADRYNPSETAELAAYAGFGGVRDTLGWYYVEKTKGVYESLPKFDEYVKLVNEKNLEMILIFAGGNKLYSGRTDAPPDTKEGHKAFTEYARFLTERYKNEVNYYEIWNEYNLTYFNPKNMDAKNYLEFQKPVYKAIKEADPDAFVVGITNGVTSKLQFEDYTPYFEQGSLEYLDAVGYHNYRDFLGSSSFIENVNYLEDMIKSHNSDKKVWVTEIGLTIVESEGHNDRERCERYIKTYAVGVGENLTPIFGYDLECDGQMASSREHHFGITKYWKDADNPHAAYGTYVVCAGLNKLMYDKTISQKISGDNGIWGYDFKNDKGEDIAVIWTENASENIGIKLGTDNVEVLDMYTNSLGTLTAENGVFSIGISGKPIYLKGKFSDFSLCDASIGLENCSVSGAENDIIIIKANEQSREDIRIEADLPDCMEIYEGQGTADSPFEVSFLTKTNSIGTYDIPVRIYKEDSLLYISEVQLTVGNPISVDISVEKAAAGGSERWIVLADVTNQSNIMPQSGTVQIVESDGVEYKSNKAVFSYLLPGQTTTMRLNLEEMKRLRKKNVLVNVSLESGYSEDFSGEFDFSFAEYAYEKPTIDGVISRNEWKGMWVSAYQEADIKSIIGWGGENDISFDAILQYDEENLYLAAVVNDDVHFNNQAPSTIWSGDSIQFAIEDGIKMGDAVSVPDMEKNFTELGIALANGKPVVYRYKTWDYILPLGVFTNLDIAITRSEGKTIYELSIPWTELFRSNYVPDDSRILGFSMLVNDNDGGGRRGWIEYNSGVGMTKNAYLFGKLNFVK